MNQSELEADTCSSAGKLVRARHVWFWFYLWLDEKVARVFWAKRFAQWCKTNYFSTLKWKPLCTEYLAYFLARSMCFKIISALTPVLKFHRHSRDIPKQTSRSKARWELPCREKLSASGSRRRRSWRRAPHWSCLAPWRWRPTWVLPSTALSIKSPSNWTRP